ncbi:MAG TPA: hypothetical protein VHG52_10450 [Thermomicrobiales bacterium]|nr:hypothetical protein [Thermomicrobiales bacterium]
MKPRFGLGRRQEPVQATEPQPVADTVEVESDATEDPSLAVESTRAPHEAPIRPDLGPPAPRPQSANQPGSGLGLVVSIAIAAIVFVLAIYATGSPTTNPLPLAQTTNALYWGVAAVATVAAGVGALFADRSAARSDDRSNDWALSVNTVWIVPVVSTAAAILLVATFHNTTMIVAGPLIAFLGNAGSLLSRDLLDDADVSAQRTATTIQALVIHPVAFFALSAVYLNKLPTPVTALLAGGLSTLLAVEAFERSPADIGRKLTLAILTGAAVAAAVAPLMWWPTHGWTGGAVLFVVFYCAVGAIQTTLERGDLRLRDAVEYGLVPFGAFLILAITA